MNELLWFDAFMDYYTKINKLSQKGINSDSKINSQFGVGENSANSESLPKAIDSGSDISYIDLNDFSYLSDSTKTKLTIDSLSTDSLFIDSLKNDSLSLSDSLLQAADTVKKDPRLLDSTARLEHFKVKRKDVPYTSIFKKKPSGLFVQPSPSNVKRMISLDSTGKFVEIKDKIGDQDVRVKLRIPIEEYIELRIKAEEREMWDELVYKYELKDTAMKSLSELIKDLTDFEIPLPSVGVLSIFGTPKISLRIGGAVDIHGAWRSETTEGVTASTLGNTRNEPDFRQQVQVNVDGMIGDKLQIGADWNTERTFEYENQLKLKYTGYEDEIIQSIEAGNVSLQTSPLIGGGEALFGIKAKFKMGPLTLTTLASQKKGESKEKTVSGGSSSQPFTIRAYGFSQNHFFLHKDYADTSESLNLFNKYYGNSTPIINQNYFIKYIEVWKSVNATLKNPNERNVNAYIDLEPRPINGYPPALREESVQELPGELAKGRFMRLEENIDYILHPETGYITFKTSVGDNEIIAVAFRQEGPTNSADDDLFFGDFIAEAGADTSKRLILTLIKPKNLQSTNVKAWNLMLKNIYPLGPRNINKEGFEFDIQYEVEGSEPQSVLGSVRLLNAFGLDLADASDNPQPDGLFDFKPGKTIIPETGEVIFPVLQPFGRNLTGALKSVPNYNYDSIKYNLIYDTALVFAKQDKIRDKWVMVGKSSGTSTASYQLGFNLVENSVKVSLNGRELTPGVDFYVDYNIGSLTIRNDAALVPGANLKITYEENDLYQFASKTLFGARGEIDFSKKTKLGFTALSLSQQTLSDKVRIGEEPLSNSIYGLDFSTTADLPFVTKALDYLFSTREMSSLTLRGEFAYMSPDPNTKKSTIESDNGQSIAYIDDFEASKSIIPIGISYTSWKDLSVPNKLSRLSRIANLHDSLTIHYKAKSFWFNILPSDVNVKQIWPQKSVARGDEQVTVLDYVFMPDRPGSYNYNPKLSDKSLAWGGIMKLLSSTANDLVGQNIEFIEFWMQPNSFEKDAKIYLDLGKITEDVIPNNKLDTEDKNFNDLIDEGEDLGIDGLNDGQEQGLLAPGVTSSDPSGDNFNFQNSSSTKKNIMDFFNINGTQGNAVLTDIGRFPDTEDLNRNGSLDQLNSYYRYEIPVDPDSTINPYIAGGGNDGWFLYRIPIKDFRDVVGTPSFSVVEYIRLFTTNTDSMLHFRMTEFNLVGNQWRKAIKEDEVLSISVVNIEDNPGVYTSPVGRERDRSRPDEEILRNEQSLNLILKDLPYGEKREAVKDLFRPLDVFNYKEMKLFLHGDTDTKGLDVYFKFGADSNNYYEYRQKLEEGWNDEVSLVFSSITAIKQRRDSANVAYYDTVYSTSGKRVIYSVKGNPSLTSIKFLAIGIINLKDPNNKTMVSGQVWVNELRVIGADDTPGWAYSASTNLKLADILSLNVNFSQTDPFFHRLAERFGSRTDARNWAVSTDINILKFLPFNMQGSNLRLNYSHSESLSKPRYLPSTDILVDEAANSSKSKTADQIYNEVQTFSSSDSWTLSGIKLIIPVEHWFIRDTFNSLTYNFTYNKSYSRNPSIESSSTWQWNAGVAYAVNISQDYHFYPADIPVLGTVLSLFTDYRNLKVYYSPQNFTWNVTAKRNKGINTTRRLNPADTSNNTTISRDFTATRGFTVAYKMTENGFLNLSTSYSVDINSSLAYLETDVLNNELSERAVWRGILNSGGFGRDIGYIQSLDFRTSPRIPTLWDLNKYFTLTLGYTTRYNWTNDYSQLQLGRQANTSSGTKIGLTLRLKALTAGLFIEAPEEEEKIEDKRFEQPNPRLRDFEKKEEEMKIPEEEMKIPEEEMKIPEGEIKEEIVKTDSLSSDSTLASLDSSAIKTKRPSVIKNAWNFIKTISKILLFDYETININFSTDNQVTATGLYGSLSGFSNFWGFANKSDNGPTRMFMLGLSVDPGLRAYSPNASISNNFSQKNSLDFKTSKPLWEGAKIDLNWKVAWTLNKSAQLNPQTDGSTVIQNLASSGTIERSFISIPPVFFLSMLKSGIKQVNELYDPKSTDATSLSEAFVKGFETLPFLGNLSFLSQFMNYMPRANWRLTWDGLEKYSIFKSFAKRVSLDHAYTSTYAESWKISPDGNQQTQSQKISYGFSPLLGLNLTLNSIWDGNFTGSLKYGVRTGYDLGITTKNITETLSREIGVTINYSKSGFDLPLFGIALKNDIEFALSYSNTKNSTIIYDMTKFTEDGTPQDGTIRTTIEPRIKYIISSKVTVSIFYKYSSVTPEGAARISPTTTTEAGLDVRISIQ